ncbi:MAG TPA: HAMP domain-containing sensor histidine kinase [Candidatus Paceibacterota bacterium]
MVEAPGNTPSAAAGHSAHAPAQAPFSSFLLKIIGSTFLFGIVPLTILFLLAYNGYEEILTEAIGAAPLDQAQFGVIEQAMRDLNVRIASTAGILFLFIVIGGTIVDYFLMRPVRLLAGFIRHINWDDPTMIPMTQSEDEIGILAAELRKGIQNFKRIRERDAELSKAKNSFLTIAAHQLRTPLTEVKWSLQAVLGGKAAAEASNKNLALAAESIDHMINLVGDLLDVVKVEEKRFGYTFKEAYIDDLVKHLIETFDPIAKAGHISLSLALPPRVPAMIVDPEGIALVLTNLISNAINYTPQHGSVRVALRISADERYLEISVEDSGIGIPAVEKEKIFGQFFRASNAKQKIPNGSGIGLFLAKTLVERHGGRLSFTSAEGEGSRFMFTLPLRSRDMPPEMRRMVDFFGTLGDEGSLKAKNAPQIQAGSAGVDNG